MVFFNFFGKENKRKDKFSQSVCKRSNCGFIIEEMRKVHGEIMIKNNLYIFLEHWHSKNKVFLSATVEGILKYLAFVPVDDAKQVTVIYCLIGTSD